MICRPIDIEDELQAYLNANGIRACATPVPANLAPPMCVVWRTGGEQRAYVQDVQRVSIDCYGESVAGAMRTAHDAVALVRDLSGRTIGTFCYASSASLPHLNPDPDHPTIPRATFSAEVVTRSEH